MCDTLKKIFKIVGIIAAIAGAAAGVYMLIKKFCPIRLRMTSVITFHAHALRTKSPKHPRHK